MDLDLKTRCIHGILDAKDQDVYRAISYPLYLSSTFAHKPTTPDSDFSHDGVSTGFTYSRQSNPTRAQLEDVITSLEGAAGTVAVSSGMAAISLVFELFSPGDHIICTEDLYGGTERLFTEISIKNGLKVDLVDTTDIANIRQAIRPETKALYIETPGNPMMEVTDLAACSALAKEYGLLLIVDNTFLSPYLQNPISFGADLVIHSGTKFLCGHNDVVAGFVCAATQERSDRLHFLVTTIGNALSPFDSWLLLRGIKTLSVRMERQQENAEKIARWLKEQPKIREVFYAGLPEHPGYAVNQAQSRGAGSMISFHTDTEQTAKTILSKLKLIAFAESLGGTETLITYPLFQTHTEVPPETRERLGITETLLRLSVGLEDVDDLIADLSQALQS